MTTDGTFTSTDGIFISGVHPEFTTTKFYTGVTQPKISAVTKIVPAKGFTIGALVTDEGLETQPLTTPLAKPLPCPPTYVMPVNDDCRVAWTAYACTHGIGLALNEYGWARRPGTFAPIPKLRNDRIRAVRAIAAAWGNGRIIGRGAHRMNKDASTRWLTAWYNGDFRTCYLIEAQCAQPDPGTHPGGNDPCTWQIRWITDACDVPAGQLIIGPWRSPAFDTRWEQGEVDNFLVAAGAHQTEHFGLYRRRRWVNLHFTGEQYEIDRLLYAEHSRPPAYTAAVYRPLSQLLQDEISKYTTGAPKTWCIAALQAYAVTNALGHATSWPDLVRRVESHVSDPTRTTTDAPLTFTTAPHQPTLDGQHRKILLLDNFGREWIYKPASEPAHHFRPEIEHAANVLARRWGYRTAQSHLIHHDGTYGQVQRRHSVRRDLTGLTLDTVADLTLHQLIELACEHLLDWAIDNDDGHGGNTLLLTDGHVVGIDKGRAWKYFGAWTGLSGNHSAHSNCTLAYTALYDAITRHRIPRTTADQIYFAVTAKAERMQRLPDKELAGILTAAQANRPHYNPSWYQTHHAEAPTNLAELITAATTRKNRLAQDILDLWHCVYTNAGWTLPTGEHIAGVNPDNHLIHSGLHSPYLHAAVAATSNWGTSTFFDTLGLEDAHLTLWRERLPDGTVLVRGQGKLRATAAHAVSQWCYTKARTWTIPYEAANDRNIRGKIRAVRECYGPPVQAPMLGELYESICATGQYALNALHQKPDPYGVLQQEVDMCLYYASHVQDLIDSDDPCTVPYVTPYPYILKRPRDLDRGVVWNMPATRHAAHLSLSGFLKRHDGDLQLADKYHRGVDQGQKGNVYCIVLPTGEEIEYRDAGTNAARSHSNQLDFSCRADDLAGGLRRIDAQLATMGLTLTPATPRSMELFYWRHLTGVMRQRADSRPGGACFNPDTYNMFWHLAEPAEQLNDGSAAELHARRAAFLSILDNRYHVTAWIGGDEHLPRFGHLDLTQPTQPCGKPHWNRIDITDADCEIHQMPSITYQSGNKYVAHYGNCLSTEARTRHLAVWKSGLSSSRDMEEGSAAFVFTRLNQEPHFYAAPHVFLRPQVLRRTSNYGFNEDHFGQLAIRSNESWFNLTRVLTQNGGSNEYCIKNHLTLLDDIEILLYRKTDERAAALQHLHDLGITHIRGLPIEERLVLYSSFDARGTAIQRARINRRP